MQFLMWYDDSKGTAADKIRAGLAAYRARFGVVATVVLVHPDDLADVKEALIVSGESQGVPVRKNNFWIGQTG
jgi:hypothetical protein